MLFPVMLLPVRLFPVRTVSSHADCNVAISSYVVSKQNAQVLHAACVCTPLLYTCCFSGSSSVVFVAQTGWTNRNSTWFPALSTAFDLWEQAACMWSSVPVSVCQVQRIAGCLASKSLLQFYLFVICFMSTQLYHLQLPFSCRCRSHATHTSPTMHHTIVMHCECIRHVMHAMHEPKVPAA